MKDQQPRAHVRCGAWLLHKRGRQWRLGRRGETPDAGCWPIAEAEQLTVGRRRPPGLARHVIATEQARLCGCCGRHSYETPLELVADHRLPEARIWRCEKHVGRLPCRIDGCGKTFALDPGEGYHFWIICSTHWRLAPRYMRDACTKISRRARRRGWDGRLRRVHAKLQERTFQAAQRRFNGEIGESLDLAEIERLFGI